MKITFQARISGYYKVAYSTRTIDVKDKWYIIPIGEKYLSCGRDLVINKHPDALWVDGSVYEIKPRSSVVETK